MDYFLLLITIFSSAIAAFFIGRLFEKKKNTRAVSPEEIKLNYVHKSLYLEFKERNASLQEKLDSSEYEQKELLKALASQEQMIDSLREQNIKQQNDYSFMHELLKKEFENLSGRLLDEKGQKIIKQNQDLLSHLLNPLKDRISDFEKKVENYYNDENRQKAALYEQVRALTELNRVVTTETKNLTKALKGESKLQGNWGEMILERILEFSGLKRDREYFTQHSLEGDEGKRMQPDIVIQLPENRHLIIDSKVSLSAYERYISEQDESIRQSYLKEHIISIKKHADELSFKNYHSLNGINSPDYVFMFVPIESALSLAVQNKEEIIYDMMKKHVIPVGPSTLLATLKTVYSLWRLALQDRNAKEIAAQAGLLYDKFVSWLTEMELIGQKLQSAQNSYQSAMNRLKNGQGNLIQRTQRLKELGAKTSKNIAPEHLNSMDS